MARLYTAFFDEISDFVADNTGFTTASTGENEAGSVHIADSLSLGAIELRHVNLQLIGGRGIVASVCR